MGRSRDSGAIERRRPPRSDGMSRVAALAWVKQGYTDGTRRLASRWIAGLARTRVTPNALTAAGISLCAASAVIVWFAHPDPWLLYWLAPIVFPVRAGLGLPDGAPAREGRKASPLRPVVDPISHRLNEG